MFELHIWPPAFSLPSIDAECIAAVTLLNQLLEPDDWTVIADHDPSGKSPTGNFPALLDTSTKTWTGGFVPIARHLKDTHNLSLHKELTPHQRLTSTSYVSAPPATPPEPQPVTDNTSRSVQAHLQTHAYPLLSTHLHTDPSNYHALTRPTFSSLLPFPLPWLTNPLMHTSHLSRTKQAHGLNFSSRAGDDDEDSDDEGGSRAEKRDTPIPSTDSPGGTLLHNVLHKRRTLLRRELRKTAVRERMRVESAVDELCKPLDALLAGDTSSTSLVAQGRKPTTTDILLLGYFSLMLYPPATRAWVPEGIRGRWSNVAAYVDRLRDTLVPSLQPPPTRVKAEPNPESTQPENEEESKAKPNNALTVQYPAPPSIPRRISTLSHSLLNGLIHPSTRYSLYNFLSPLFPPKYQHHTTTANALQQPTSIIILPLLTAITSIVGGMTIAHAGWHIFYGLALKSAASSSSAAAAASTPSPTATKIRNVRTFGSPHDQGKTRQQNKTPSSNNNTGSVNVDKQHPGGVDASELDLSGDIDRALGALNR
ncbi:MAG: hypothetical protein M1831_001992 [Alyxoria varia]|nr:MAG: hypothetical protein M1831_001992 [Alyxoria varia]